MNYNGALRRGSGIASTSKVGDGFYLVTFNQSIANCVRIATPSIPFALIVVC